LCHCLARSLVWVGSVFVRSAVAYLRFRSGFPVQRALRAVQSDDIVKPGSRFSLRSGILFAKDSG